MRELKRLDAWIDDASLRGVDDRINIVDIHEDAPETAAPFALWIRSRSNEHAKVRISPIDIVKFSRSIISDTRCPHSVSMLRTPVSIVWWQSLYGMIYYLPVHEILGMKNRQTGDAVE